MAVITQPLLAKYVNENDGQGRFYISPTTGNAFPSVTRILKGVPKDLSQYAATKTAEWAAENWMSLGERSTEKAVNMTKFKWKNHANDRAEVGNGVHAWVEAEHTNWDYPIGLDDEQLRIIEQWEKLKTVYEIEPLLTEFSCFDEENKSAGTADGMWYIDGVLTTVDLKTSKKTYDEHWMQLSALGHSPVYFEEVDEGEGIEVLCSDKKKHWFVERELPKFERYALIHLRADYYEVLWDEPDEMKLHWEQYKRYAQLHHIGEDLKEIRKSKGKEVDTW